MFEENGSFEEIPLQTIETNYDQKTRSESGDSFPSLSIIAFERACIFFFPLFLVFFDHFFHISTCYFHFTHFFFSNIASSSNFDQQSQKNKQKKKRERDHEEE